MKRGISPFVIIEVHDGDILSCVSIIHEQEGKGNEVFDFASRNGKQFPISASYLVI